MSSHGGVLVVVDSKDRCSVVYGPLVSRNTRPDRTRVPTLLFFAVMSPRVSSPSLRFLMVKSTGYRLGEHRLLYCRDPWRLFIPGIADPSPRFLLVFMIGVVYKFGSQLESILTYRK